MWGRKNEESRRRKGRFVGNSGEKKEHEEEEEVDCRENLAPKLLKYKGAICQQELS